MLAACVALCGGCATATEAVAPEKLESAVQAKVTEVCRAAGFPGMTLAIAMPDGRVLTAAAGSSGKDRAPLSSSSRMPAGSVGKMFVAAAILQAVDDGVLDLDAPIERWLGAEPWFGRIPNARDLTLRRLLQHRSGIPDALDSEAYVEALTTDVERVREPREILEFVFDRAPDSPAGTQYAYTDMNFVIAGVVFEHAVGRALFAEIERRILRPLALDETVPTERRDWRDVVSGVLDRENPFFAASDGGESLRDGRFTYAATAEYAGGGLISTSRDLARWVRALFEGAVLPPARLSEMLDAQPAEDGAAYGLGVEVSSSGAGPVYGHDGWIPGYQTEVVYFPEFHLAAALQIDSDPMERYHLAPGDALGQVVEIPIRMLRAKTR